MTNEQTAWTAWHLHLGTTARSAHDRVVTEAIGPAVAHLDGRAWFFIRYWQRGPHLRLRVAGLAPDELPGFEKVLGARLADAGRLAPQEEPLDAEAFRAGAGVLAAGESGENRSLQSLLPPGVHAARYEPEYGRYGGPALMPASERMFRVSSELVLALVPRIRGKAHRAQLALRGTMAAASALGGPDERASYYAHGLAAWRGWAAQAGYGDQVLDSVTAIAGNGDGSAVDPLAHGPFGGWHEEAGVLVDAVRAASPVPPGMILSSHTHMLHNRLGLSMLEELRTYAWLANAFPAPTGAAPHLAPVG
ncbi:thiopeptide-type bacteriocin biosynthesis protein [Streptomyces sp. B21-083]|uniref:thiopeptide-type bacteriocin biosynthesis protein n=1 Tax=Streptomyces sp. B21-083 TaxID=3039410 RepID=UPI002FF3AE97